MGRLRAEFLYEVGHLWLCANALGESAAFGRDGLDIEIVMPKEGAQFADRVKNDNWFWVALTGTSMGPAQGPGEFFEVRLVSVVVRGDSTTSSADFPPQGSVGDAANRAYEFLKRAQAAADTSLAGFIDWARVWGEPWLGLHRQVPPQIGRQLLFDDETNVALPIGWPPMTMRPPGTVALEREDFAHVARHLGQGDEPPLAEVLLADAVYLAGEQHPDPGRAVLTAAIALEVRVKEVLREGASPQAQRVVDLMLDSPRDWPQPAAALFDKATGAVLGRSLRNEQRTIYNDVDRLFQVRNRIAHRGEIPSAKEARDLVENARVAFVWLGVALSDSKA
jgi:hypothetical protein